MTKYKKLLLYSSILALLWVVLAIAHLLPWYLLWLLLAFVMFKLVDGAIHIQRNFFLGSINSLSDIGIPASEKKITLSFDDGIHPTHTEKVLNILSTAEVKAMFFLIGKHIPTQELLVQRMHNEGHVIGNHSYSHHFWFDLKSAGNMADEIQQTNQQIKDCTGYMPKYFRPPYGVTNPMLSKAVRITGMQSVGWTIRSKDTVASSSEALLAKLKAETKPNAILLLHDRCDITVSILTDYIEYAKAQGYTFVTLS